MPSAHAQDDPPDPVVDPPEEEAKVAPSREGFGLGAYLGEPIGVTGKVFFTPMHALDLIVAWDFTDQAIDVTLDYLAHFDVIPLEDVDTVQVPLYVGIGIKTGQPTERGSFMLGIRIPLGVAVSFTEMPLELFAEVAPIVRLTPVTAFDIDGGVGVRWYF